MLLYLGGYKLTFAFKYNTSFLCHIWDQTIFNAGIFGMVSFIDYSVAAVLTFPGMASYSLLGWVHVEDALSSKYKVKPFN